MAATSPWPWAGGHGAFNGTGGLVEVQGDLSFKGLQFVADSYALAGGGMLETEAGGGELRVLAGATATIGTRIGGTGAPLSLPLPLTMALQLFGACVNRVMAAGGPPGNPAGLHCRPEDPCRRRVDPAGLDLCSSHNAGRLAQMAAGATPPPPPRRRGRSAHPPAPHARPDSPGRLHISATRPHSPQAAIRAVTARLPEYPQCPHARAASGGGLVLGRTVQGCLLCQCCKLC